MFFSPFFFFIFHEIFSKNVRIRSAPDEEKNRKTIFLIRATLPSLKRRAKREEKRVISRSSTKVGELLFV